MMKKERGPELLLLSSYPFFSLYNAVSLVPFAELLESHCYRLGDIILEEEDYPSHMFFILKGRVKLVKEDFISRKINFMKKI